MPGPGKAHRHPRGIVRVFRLQVIDDAPPHRLVILGIVNILARFGVLLEGCRHDLPAADRAVDAGGRRNAAALAVLMNGIRDIRRLGQVLGIRALRVRQPVGKACPTCAW